MSQANNEFTKTVTKNLKNNQVISKLSKKQQSKDIVSAISVMQTAVFAKTFKEFENQGKSVDLKELSSQGGLVANVYAKLLVGTNYKLKVKVLEDCKQNTWKNKPKEHFKRTRNVILIFELKNKKKKAKP